VHGAVRTHRKSRETIAQSEDQPMKNEVNMLIEKETKKKKQRNKEKETKKQRKTKKQQRFKQ